MEAGILPSRQELLSRIELVCELDSRLIAVTGEVGIGKSALLEFFIEHHCVDRTKCFVQAIKDQSTHQLREQLLVQLLPGCAYDPHLSLAQNIAEAQLPDPLNVIIVIDSAEFAAAEIFQDLLGLLKDHNGHQFCAIFAQPRDPERINKLNDGRGLIEIHLEPLSKSESRMLLEFYYRSMIDSDRAQVQKFIERCHGLPAKLLKWEDGTETLDSPGKLSKKTLVTSAVIAFLVTVMVVASWYFIPLKNSEVPLQTQVEIPLNESLQQPSEEAEDESLQAVKNGETTQTDLPTDKQPSEQLPDVTAEQTQEKTDDKNELGTLLVQNWSDSVNKAKTAKKIVDKTPVNAAVVVSNELKPLFKRKAEPQTEQLAADDAPQLDVEVTQTPSQHKPVDSAVAFEQQAQATDDKMDNQWFLSQPVSDTVIQLAGVSNTRVLETFLLEHQLKSITHIYQSVRNGHPWYVVTTKAYTTPDEARQAITGLSASLRSTQPWVKSIRAIQSEIINANKKN
ncbi:MAG: AAA family ATPase [Algicola sp.]|nr:AAA family ATPase [Algicola sp.]